MLNEPQLKALYEAECRDEERVSAYMATMEIEHPALMAAYTRAEDDRSFQAYAAAAGVTVEDCPSVPDRLCALSEAEREQYVQWLKDRHALSHG